MLLHLSLFFSLFSQAAKSPLDPQLSLSPTAFKTKPVGSSSSNGSTPNFSRLSENSLSLEYVSPTKKASDHSITQIISGPTSNHSAHVSSIKHQSLAFSNNTENPTTSSHTTPIKHGQPTSGSSKSKTDIHHRQPQSSSNSSTNNNFVNNNNNNNNKPSAQRLLDGAPACIVISDTDDCETTPKKPKQHKHKHNKKNRDNVSNNVPLQNTAHLLHQMSQQASAMGVNSTANDEVDHNKIIHDLKVNRSFLRKYFDLQL